MESRIDLDDMNFAYELDSADEDGSVYEYAARSVLSLYSDFVVGNPLCTLAILSAHPLDPSAREALRASADRLGYGRDACAWMIVRSEPAKGRPSEKIGSADLKTLIEGLDPIALVATDVPALSALCHAYDTIVEINNTGRINGRTVVGLGDFSIMLESDESKQLAWRLLKRIQLNRK